ncbi:MAG: NUDIX hydrolase [Planctomycetaceae bacterium]|nr:NUDIX hydrolase [Planctomycetaceae bacterium]
MTDDNRKQHGPWTVLKTTDEYSDPWLSVRKDDVIRPDGLPGTHSVVTIKPGVCVLAIDGDDVILTREFHYAVGRVTLEAVSGGREPGEEAMECASRELHEELGIRAASWQQLTTIDPFTASVVSPTVLFLATDLTFEDAQPEGTELIEPVRMTLTDAYAAVCDGRITHAPTCLLIQRRWIDVLSDHS